MMVPVWGARHTFGRDVMNGRAGARVTLCRDRGNAMLQTEAGTQVVSAADPAGRVDSYARPLRRRDKPSRYRRFQALQWPLGLLELCANFRAEEVRPGKRQMCTLYPVWALRYWWTACALMAHAQRCGGACTVVDLGCNRGMMKRFVPFQDTLSWIGLDRNIEHSRLHAANYQGLHECDFDDPLPLPDASADIVIALHVFEHLQRPEFTIRQIQRILRPGGILLAGSPVLPKPLAVLQEWRFRRQMETGRRHMRRHRHAFWPRRWVNLVHTAGLTTETLCGTHFLRWTGFVLENYRWWIRLNQLWGALFPSLGSEIYLQARRPS